ncbi:hypothetical protein LTR62_002157 [Meristemomyces frigidus]|uniref:Sodium/calcium exchanger membrane region domain-containing protein n=1 Tax=Meristemomyces frigidus TaxID=1508187 RepID=A0AAN7T7M9_9PEZI|nr:hypothetical protein LTR62_002157 [Meristemomyces frigidus]
MHSIKKLARREAWYGEPDQQSYNPFGRYNIHRQQRKAVDPEQGIAGNGLPLSQVQTENNLGPSPVEAQRKEDWQPTPGPHKAPTYPQGPSNDLPEKHGDKVDGTTQSTSASKGSSDDSTAAIPQREINGGPNGASRGVTEESVGVEDGTRKRKSRRFLPWKHSGKEEEKDEARTDTNESKGKKFKHKPTFMSQFKAVFFSWINILLILAPVGIALHFTNVNKIVVFVINFLAIIPLAAMLSYSTEELAMYIGETLGGLLNATFGNAVELIVSVIALTQGKILIVQTSLIGSMLSNLLLVLGMCFFFGGLKRTEQFFNLTVAQTAASLLALSIGSLIIPTAFSIFTPGNADDGVTAASRGTAVMLLFTYCCYLFFQLSTHIDMYNAPSQKSPKRPSGKKDAGDALRGMATIGAGTGAAATGGQINQENLIHEEPEDEEGPQLTRVGALVVLAGSTVLIALCAEFMVSAIGAVAQHVSQEFIGLILLPIVGNAAEHATAVTVAIKDKMDLSIGVAVGSSLQVALLVLPFMVCLNWFGVGAPNDLTLSFDGFQVSVLFIAIIVVNYVIQDGKSHWLEGMLLQVTYLVIAVAAWFYPTSATLAG